MMQKILSYMFLTCIVVGLQILVMIFGWGLHPKSWWWVIGVGIFGSTAVRALIDAVMKEDKKDLNAPIKRTING